VLAAALAPDAGECLELEGTWYVLVHYRDADSARPEAWRWEDRIWVLERDGDRLQWTDYPIVVFEDESGRFERSSTNRMSRVVRAWEPSPGQLDQIETGLEVNPRGSKSKPLARTPGGEWRSPSGPGAVSATVVTYSETWSIADPDRLPVFAREDVLASGVAHGMEGRTEYRTEQMLDGGRVLRGSYERDGTRQGTFRLIRSRPPSRVKGSGKSQSERVREILILNTLAESEGAALLRETIEARLSENGVWLTASDLDALAEEALALLAAGSSPSEAAEQLERSAREKFFSFAQPGSHHDDSVRYAMPFAAGVPRRLSQGVGGDVTLGVHGVTPVSSLSHEGRYRYAFDVEMPVGTSVLAARDGTIVRVVDGFTRGGPLESLRAQANVVIVQHADGTWALYAHLSPGLAVEVGQTVRAGHLLGHSGNTGFTTGPHLHFGVQRLDAEGRPESVYIRFDDGTARGLVPVAGAYYAGGSESHTSGGGAAREAQPGAAP
jgi:murein DD-endopeptidase MepM/ murein hydrolase activator NlpD